MEELNTLNSKVFDSFDNHLCAPDDEFLKRLRISINEAADRLKYLSINVYYEFFVPKENLIEYKFFDPISDSLDNI